MKKRYFILPALVCNRMADLCIIATSAPTTDPSHTEIDNGEESNAKTAPTRAQYIDPFSATNGLPH